MALLFTKLCRIIGTKTLYTTTYHVQYNRYIQRFSRPILYYVRYYLFYHPRQWDIFSTALTYE